MPIQTSRLNELRALVKQLKSEDCNLGRIARSVLARTVNIRNLREVQEVVAMFREEAVGARPADVRCLLKLLPQVSPCDNREALCWAYEFLSASNDFVRCAATDAVVALTAPGNDTVFRDMCRFARDGSRSKRLS